MNLLHELWPDNPSYLFELLKHADGLLNAVNDKVLPLFLNVLKNEYVIRGMGMGNHARILEFFWSKPSEYCLWFHINFWICLRSAALIWETGICLELFHLIWRLDVKWIEPLCGGQLSYFVEIGWLRDDDYLEIEGILKYELLVRFMLCISWFWMRFAWGQARFCVWRVCSIVIWSCSIWLIWCIFDSFELDYIIFKS